MAPSPQDRTSFFIEPDECVHCGVCQQEAPGHIRWGLDGQGASEVYKPPRTQDEITLLLNAINVCCVDCIYYGGADPDVIDLIQDTLHPGAALNGPKAKYRQAQRPAQKLATPPPSR